MNPISPLIQILHRDVLGTEDAGCVSQQKHNRN